MGHVVRGKAEHVGIKAARQPHEGYRNALQLRLDTGDGQAAQSRVETTGMIDGTIGH